LQKNKDNFTKRNILITGATHGLGLALANSLISTGANIAICARTEAEISSLVESLNQIKDSTQTIIGFKANVCNEEEVHEMYCKINERIGSIDTLVSNAGIVGPIGKFLEVDHKEWVNNVDVNFLGSVILIRKFLPDMLIKRHGKVIQLSGGGASNPLFGMSAYAASKSAIVRFIENLSIEYKDSGVYFNSVAPGMLKTRLLNEMLEAGPDKIGDILFEKSVSKSESSQDSSQKAVELIKFLISAAGNGVNGKLISAEWDNWLDWPSNLSKLEDSDIYTLRRITRKERTEIWGDN